MLKNVGKNKVFRLWLAYNIRKSYCGIENIFAEHKPCNYYSYYQNNGKNAHLVFAYLVTIWVGGYGIVTSVFLPLFNTSNLIHLIIKNK